MDARQDPEGSLKERALRLLSDNRPADARAPLQEACARGSRDADVWYLLGIVNARLGCVNEVETCLRRALALRPEHVEATLRLGEALAYFGRFAEAVEVLQGLAQRQPELAEVWLRLGNVLEAMGQHAAAIDCYRHVATRQSGNDLACTCLGNALYFTGDYAGAIEAYRHAAAANPGNLKAQLGLHLSLPHVYSSHEQMLEKRANFAAAIDRLEAMSEQFKRSPTLINDLQWSNNFYLAYQGLDDRPLQEAFGRFFSEMVGHALPQFMRPIAARAGGKRRLRVGFVGHFLHTHTVSFYFNNWILRLDGGCFETFVYHIDPITDDTSRRLLNGCANYHPMTGAIAGMAQVIRNDALDILAYPEVGMYSKVQWLAALRLAPIQCAAWGHPVTTGLANMDYVLSAEATEPVAAQAHYSETLACLSGIGVYVEPPLLPEPRARQDYDLPANRHLFLCPQSLFKIHVDMDALMIGVAKQDPQALILVFEDYKPAVTHAYRQRIEGAFAAADLDPERHLRFLPRMAGADFLCINQFADVMLDTVHWSGGRTSLDALAAGLPIVTSPGAFSRGRQTYGMLNALGLDELIATDAEDYVTKAVTIADNPERRADLSKEIVARSRGVVFEDPAPLASLENTLQAWVQVH